MVKIGDKIVTVSEKMRALKHAEIPTEEFKELEKQADKVKNTIVTLTRKQAALQKEVPTEAYKEVQKQIEKTETRLNALLKRKEQFKGKKRSATWLNLNEDIEELENSLPRLEDELQDLIDCGQAFQLGKNPDEVKRVSAELNEAVLDYQKLNAERQKMTDSGENFQLGSETEEYKKLSSTLKYLQNDLSAATVRHSELITKQRQSGSEFDNVEKSAKKAFRTIEKGTKKSSGLMKTFQTRLKGIALSLLIFRQITKAWNSFISGMKEGMKNLAKYSSDYNKVMSDLISAIATLKNSFATAFEPIANLIIPQLTKLVDWLIIATDKVAQFMAALQGKNTYTKAIRQQKDYAESLKETEKAMNRLAKFDELDVLSDDKNKADGSDMFEEVPIDSGVIDFLDNIKSLLEPIIEYGKELAGIFGQGFMDGLGDVGPRLEIINKGLKRMKTALIDIFTDSEVQSSMDGFAKSFTYMLGSIVGSTASIGLTIAANLIGGLGDYLENNTDRIKWYLVNMFDVRAETFDIISEAVQSIAYIFEAFASEDGIKLTSNITGIFADAFMYVDLLCAKFARDIIDVLTRPFIDNKEGFREVVEDFLGVLAEVTGTIKEFVDSVGEKMNEVYDEHFKPFFDSIAEGLSEITAKFLEFWKEYIQPILDKIAAKFDECVTNYITPAVHDFLDLIGEIIDILKILWEDWVVPFINWLIENVLPAITPILETAVDLFFGVLNAVVEVFNGCIKTIKGFLEITKGLLTLDMETILQGVTTMFEGIYGQISGFANLIISVIEGMVNAVIDGINRMISSLNSLNVDIPDWVPGIGGGKLGFNIPEISPVSLSRLPKLATGAVIKGGNPFPAILGDQPAGQTNIEAPLSTIQEALQNVIDNSNMGNGPLTLEMTLDGKIVGRAFLPYIKEETSRIGATLVEGV